MGTKNRIRDGYSRAGYIEPVPGLHEGLSFTYRPMLPEQVEDLIAAIDKAKAGAGYIPIIADVVSKQIEEWSEVDESNKPLKPSLDVLRLFPHPLLMRVRGIVEGRFASDMPPDRSPAELEQFVRGKLAEAKGERPGEKELRDDQKN